MKRIFRRCLPSINTAPPGTYALSGVIMAGILYTGIQPGAGVYKQNAKTMIIEINDTTTLAAISDAFAGAFPSLRIHFFEVPHDWDEASAPGDLLPVSLTITAVRKKMIRGNIEVHGWHKTGTVEQSFYALFGISAQILRQEAGGWVQTSASDGHTLEQQINIARNNGQELLDAGKKDLGEK